MNNEIEREIYFDTLIFMELSSGIEIDLWWKLRELICDDFIYLKTTDFNNE